MKRIFLNRLGVVFHAILATATEGEDHVLASRVCMSLDEARRLVERWQRQFAVAAEDIHDNSQVDMNKLLAGIDTNFTPGNN